MHRRVSSRTPTPANTSVFIRLRMVWFRAESHPVHIRYAVHWNLSLCSLHYNAFKSSTTMWTARRRYPSNFFKLHKILHNRLFSRGSTKKFEPIKHREVCGCCNYLGRFRLALQPVETKRDGIRAIADVLPTNARQQLAGATVISLDFPIITRWT